MGFWLIQSVVTVNGTLTVTRTFSDGSSGNEQNTGGKTEGMCWRDNKFCPCVRVQLGVWEPQWSGRGGLLAEDSAVVYLHTGPIRGHRSLPAPYPFPAQEQAVHLR